MLIKYEGNAEMAVFIFYYVQRAIIHNVCMLELWFLCSAHPIIVLFICMKFHENISNDLKIQSGHKYMVEMAIINILHNLLCPKGNN